MPTWLPPEVLPTPAHPKRGDLSISHPGGKPIKIPILQALAYNPRPGSKAVLLLGITRASDYPAGYWASFVSSPYYGHHRSKGRLVLFTPQSHNAALSTSFEENGYLVNASAFHLPLSDLLTFDDHLVFRAR